MGINTKACKAKGRRLQNKVRDLLRGSFPELEEDDKKNRSKTYVAFELEHFMSLIQE